MAITGREYRMGFILNAAMGKEFQGTFNAAQKLLAETQQEIQALNKMQSDISAYERQQQAVENTSRKLADLQKEYDNIQREIQETEGFSSSLENKLIEKQRAIDNTSAALDKQTAKLDQMGNELREAGVDTDNLADKSKELAEKQKELAEQNLKAAEAAKSYGVESVNAFEAVGSALVAAGIVKGLKELYGAYKECVSISMEFGETMSAVEAISGASADDMEVLTQRAKELGATTKFTATESAQAMTYMAMAGWDATDMISGMDGVMQLAAASGEDLAQVSDIVTDNLTAFGLTAKDTAHFSDVLAAAATNSNTSVGIMGETFKNCAPLAGALGYSVEDVAVAIGLMANAGIKGSNAGTALKNIFNGLLGEVTLTSEAFGEVTYSAVNSDGTMKTFGETLDDLRGYFAQMTGAEKMMNAEALVGQRAMAGFVQLMNSAGDDVDSLTDSINNCAGSAEKMANIRLDNLSGQVTLLNSATDALKTTIGEAFEPELRTLAEIGTDIMTDINEFAQEHPVLVKAILGITAAAGTAVGVYLLYTNAKKLLNTYRAASALLQVKEAAAAKALAGAEAGEAAATSSAAAAQTALNVALESCPIGWIIAMVGMLAISIYKLVDAANEFHDEVFADSIEMQDAIDAYRASVDELGDSYEDTLGAAAESSNKALEYINRLKELEAQGVTSPEARSEYATLIERLKATMPGLTVEIDEQTGLLKEGAAALEQQLLLEKERIKLEAIRDYAIELEKQRLQLQQDYNAAVEKQSGLWDRYEKERRRVSAAVTGDAKKEMGAFEKIGQYLSGASGDTSLPGYAAGATEAIVDYSEAYKEAAEAQDAAVEESSRLLAEADDQIEQLWNEYSILNSEIEDNTGAVDGNNSSNSTAVVTMKDVQNELVGLKEKYEEAYEAAFGSISGQYNLWDTAAVVIPTDINTINTALETQTSYWSDYNTDLSSLLARTGDVEGLAEVIASFADGSTESVNAIAGMAAATDEDLRLMVANWQAVQAVQQEAADAIADIDVFAELEDVQDDFEQAIDNMDLSDPARIAAENTMNAYIEGLRSGTLDAITAATQITNLVTQALGGKYIVTPKGGGGNSSNHAYAGGTDYASPGWALIGENGPELALMQGGERVFDARETARMLNGGGDTSITIAPVINVTGGGNETDIMEAVEGVLIPRVIEALEDQGIDARRRRYA